MASTPAGLPFRTEQAAAVRRPELEDPLNRHVYHPLARRLARLLHPLGVSANAVSVAGMVTVWAAAAAYVGLAWPQSFVIGFALHLLWHVFDGADGDLARLKGTTGPTGELIDGLCDYWGHILLYVALAYMLQDDIGGWAWIWASAAGASRMFQANHAESQRRFYLWWVYEIAWLKHAEADGHDIFKGRNWFSQTFGRLAQLYMKAVGLMAPHADRIDSAVERARDDPARARRIAQLVRQASRRGLVFQKLLGPNPRTLLLGASMALATPLPYFVAEAVVLNLLLIWSVAHHNAVARRLAEKIG